MLKLIKVLVTLLLLVLLVAIGTAAIVLESQPLVVANSGQQVDHAESVKNLMQQLSVSARNRNHKQQIVIQQNQLNSLVGFAQRAHNKIHGKVEIKPQASRFWLSYTLPNNPFGRYLNFDITLLPGPGVIVEQVKVGPLNIPGNIALNSIITLANWYTNSHIASQFIQQVESVEMTDKTMRLTVLPLDQFLQNLNYLKGGVAGVSDQQKRFRISYYLKKMYELPVSKTTTKQSLAEYIQPVFGLALKRSTLETAALENEAAILALAIFAGHHRFANLVGDVHPADGRVLLPKSKPTLNNRVDLNQHFILSAAIKILSEQGLSIAIGEFKELMDRGNNGSGYSFVDLAADIAGVEFAISATSPQKAQAIQQLLASSNDEALFFPNVVDLPEGLSKAEFNQQFSYVDSPEYLKLVNKIKRRIAQLPIHQTTKQP